MCMGDRSDQLSGNSSESSNIQSMGNNDSEEAHSTLHHMFFLPPPIISTELDHLGNWPPFRT